jgi:transposase InsO family protein
MTDHIQHVAHTLALLTKHGLRIKLAKCHFAQTTVKLLGHIVSSTHPAGLRPDPENLLAMKQFPKPTTPLQIQRFMGMLQYYSRHFPRLSIIAAPFHAERSKSSFTWTSVHDNAFQAIRTELIQKPVTLSFPDFSRPLHLITDASVVGFGCILAQPAPDDAPDSPRHIIACYSRTTSPAEKNYSPTLLELAALYWSLLKTEQYTLGRHFTVWTDHRALTFMHSQRHLNSMLSRWFLILLRFNFTVNHKPGTQNVVADALSRAPLPLPHPSPSSPAPIAATTSASPTASPPPSTSSASTSASPLSLPPSDPPVSALPSALPPWSSSATIPVLPHHHLDVFHNKNVPDSATTIQRHLERTHALGHFGEAAMFQALWAQDVWWPSIRQDIKQLLATCADCQKYSYGKHGYHPLSSLQSTLPMDHLAIDLLKMPASSRKHIAVLTVKCLFTSFVFLLPLTNTTARTVALLLWSRIFSLFGLPKTIQSDNGPEFVNHIFHTLATLYGIDHRTTSAYHPRANGAAERINLPIRQTILKHVQGDISSWDLWIPFVQFAMNSKVSSLTGSTPFTLMFARNSFPPRSASDQTPLPPSDLADSLASWQSHHSTLIDLVYPAVSSRISKIRKQAIETFKNHHRIIAQPFPLGSLVMVYNSARTSKVDPIYIGPCKVIHVNRNQSYTLSDNSNRVLKKIPISHMKLVSRFPIDNPNLPPSFQSSNAESHEVKSILSHYPINGSFDYLVQWKDSSLPSSWIAAKDFDEPKLIRDYWNSLKTSPTSSLPKSLPKLKIRFKIPGPNQFSSKEMS